MRFESMIPIWALVILCIFTLGVAVGHYRMTSKTTKTSANKMAHLRVYIMLALLCFALTGPKISSGSTSLGVTNVDVIMAVDTTPSMAAPDYVGDKTRLEGAISDMIQIANSLKGAQFEIITFDTEAHVGLPLTNDLTAVNEALNSLTVQRSAYSKGSSIDKPIDQLQNDLKHGKSITPERKRMVFYLGDGEQTASDQVKSFAPLKPLIDGGAVLGYGTATGSKIIDPYAGNKGGVSYISTVDDKTSTLTPAISKIDANALTVIANDTSTKYIDRNNGGAITDITKLSKAPALTDRSAKVKNYIGIYWLIAIPITVLLFIEWKIIIRKLIELWVIYGRKK